MSNQSNEYPCIVGIDPGLAGGIACLEPDGLMVMRMPVIGGKGAAKRMDAAEIARILDEIEPCHVIVERQQAMPKQGASSTFKTGVGYGMLLGVLAAMKIPYTTVAPAVWKRKLGVPSNKGEAKARATQMFPNNVKDWSLVRDDGLAEAALIAEYGRQTIHPVSLAGSSSPPSPQRARQGALS